MSDPYIGEIRVFGFSFPPRGWAVCDGSLLKITIYPAVNAVLGTTYGGDGKTNFGLPNLQNRIPVCQGTGEGLTAREQGQVGGSDTETLTLAQIPKHAHVVNAAKSPALGDNDDSTIGSYFAQFTGGNGYAQPGTTSATMATAMCTETGGSQSHTNVQPVLLMNFCIALVGAFPKQ